MKRNLSEAQKNILVTMADEDATLYRASITDRWWLRWPNDKTKHVNAQTATNMLLTGLLDRSATYHPSHYSLAHTLSSVGRVTRFTLSKEE